MTDHTATQFTVPTVAKAVAAAIPDRELLIQGEQRYSYAQVMERSNRLAAYLHSRGLGCHTERSAIAGHEVGQDLLGIYAYNGNEFVEALLGTFGARVAPFNVNFRYVKSELQYLLADSGATALIYHSAFAPRVAEVLPDLPQLRVLIQIADKSGNDLVYGAVDYETVHGVVDARPGEAQVALAMARLLDDPKAKNQQPAAAKVLASLLDKLHSASARGRRGRLALVRTMSDQGGA